VGELTSENEILKKGLKNSLNCSPRKGKSSGYGGISAFPSAGNVK